MKIKQFIAIFALAAKMAFAQNGWIGAGIPYATLQINCLYNDTISDRLYTVGQILNPSWSKIAILSYDGSIWNIIGNVYNNGQVQGIVRHNNDIIACGFFTSVNGVSVNNIARYDGVNWHFFGNFNSNVRRLKVMNGDLYACGTFSIVDSIPCNGIAKWNGSNWENVHSFPFTGAYVYDCEIFQGDLYVGGNSFGLGATNYDISVYKNGSWQMVGNGILGGSSVVDRMLVYKNELIVAGLIWRKEGNLGDGIQKWNGSSWSDLGMGLRNGINPNTSQPHVYDMKIYNNELYVAGLFDYADSLYSKHLAKWDGDKWCNFPTQDFTSTNGVVDIYHDTIYTGCGYDTLNGDTINYLAKMLSLQPLGCRITGIEEIENNEELIIFPNPATETIKLLNLSPNSLIVITNLTGCVLFQANLNENQTIDLNQFSKGIYIIQAQSNETIKAAKLIKQ